MRIQFGGKKPKLNKWHFQFHIDHYTLYQYSPFMRTVNFHIMKMKKMPPEAALPSRGDYSGFIFSFSLFWPFKVNQWR